MGTCIEGPTKKCSGSFGVVWGAEQQRRDGEQRLYINCVCGPTRSGMRFIGCHSDNDPWIWVLRSKGTVQDIAILALFMNEVGMLYVVIVQIAWFLRILLYSHSPHSELLLRRRPTILWGFTFSCAQLVACELHLLYGLSVVRMCSMLALEFCSS